MLRWMCGKIRKDKIGVASIEDKIENKLKYFELNTINGRKYAC